MFGNVKTVYFAMLQLAKTLKRDHEVLQYSTLNEKLNIQSGVALAAGEEPDLTYMTIGRGGYVNVGTNGRNTLMHKVTDACLFEHIPFIIRETSNDLDPSERTRYRLRRLETHGGVQYFCYYGLKLDFTSATPTVSKITVNAGVQDTVPFIPTAGQVAPTPVTLDGAGRPITTSNTSISVDAPVETTLTSNDLQEIRDACEIIYGNASSAIISEIAYCSGVDRQVTSTEGGVSVTYMESIACQPCSFVNDDINTLYTSGSYTIRYILGTTLRLLT